MYPPVISPAGIFLPFYVIEVEIRPQTGKEKVWFRTEYGQCYERRHGSTTNTQESEDRRMVSSSTRCGQAGLPPRVRLSALRR